MACSFVRRLGLAHSIENKMHGPTAFLLFLSFLFVGRGEWEGSWRHPFDEMHTLIKPSPLYQNAWPSFLGEGIRQPSLVPPVLLFLLRVPGTELTPLALPNPYLSLLTAYLCMHIKPTLKLVRHTLKLSLINLFLI